VTAQPAEPGQAYEWPPLPILDGEVAAAIMAARLGAAWSDLEEERQRVITSATLGRKDLVDAFLTEFQQAILAFLGAVELDVTRFIELHIAPAYQDAARRTLGRDVTWTATHVGALTSLASDTYADFLERSRQAERVSNQFVRAVREASAVELPKIAAGGRTARRQAADRLEERLLTKYGIDSITYRDGSRVTPRTYARMAARTKSAVAYNAGTLNACVESGVGWVEVFDGPECGWKSHHDEDRAARSIRTVAEAGRYAIAHPQCRRSFGPRPDITSESEAEDAKPFGTEEQLADMQQYTDDNRATSTRPAAARRARLAVKRQARQLGATSTDEVAGIIRSIRAEVGIYTGES
jgi:hypothetical protein